MLLVKIQLMITTVVLLYGYGESIGEPIGQVLNGDQVIVGGSPTGSNVGNGDADVGDSIEDPSVFIPAQPLEL